MKRKSNEMGTCKLCKITQTIENTGIDHRRNVFKIYCKLCDNAYHKQLRKDIKLEVLTHYSATGKAQCNCCGESRYEFLTLDHIFNDGGQERKRLNIKGGWNFYVYLKKQKYPIGYATLCFNCNSAKGAYGYCPHEQERLYARSDPVGGQSDKI